MEYRWASINAEMKIIRIVGAGCNRECFALTEDGRVFLLRYSSGDNYKWLEMPSIPPVDT